MRLENRAGVIFWIHTRSALDLLPYNASRRSIFKYL